MSAACLVAREPRPSPISPQALSTSQSLALLHPHKRIRSGRGTRQAPRLLFLPWGSLLRPAATRGLPRRNSCAWLGTSARGICLWPRAARAPPGRRRGGLGNRGAREGRRRPGLHLRVAATQRNTAECPFHRRGNFSLDRSGVAIWLSRGPAPG